MKNQGRSEDLKEDFDCEAGMNERIEEIIAAKKAENCVTLGRLRVAEAAWKKVVAERDKEAADEIRRLDDEAVMVGEARLSLGRHMRLRISKTSYGIACRAVDRDSGVGLPGLLVDITVSPPGKDKLRLEGKTDKSGSYFVRIPAKQLSLDKKASTRVTIALMLPPDTIVHQEEVLLKPKAGTTDDVTLAIKHTEPLSAVVAYGRRLKESVEKDEELVKLRHANMKEAYSALSHLSDATLSGIGNLRRGLSGGEEGGGGIPEKREKPIGATGLVEQPIDEKKPVGGTEKGKDFKPTKEKETDKKPLKEKKKIKPDKKKETDKKPLKEKKKIKPDKKKETDKKPLKEKKKIKPAKEKETDKKPLKEKKKIKPDKKKETDKKPQKKKVVKPAKKKKAAKKKTAKLKKKKATLTTKKLGKFSKLVLKKKHK